MSFKIPVTVHHERIEELAEVTDRQKKLVRRLNIFVTDFDDEIRSLLAAPRGSSGIVVVAQTNSTNTVDTGLQTGDVIHAFDRTPLQSTSQFQDLVRNLKSGDPVVLQIERSGKLQYLAFEME